ncbi:PD-(D/E)XK nuclease family protein [Streptomyces sp. NBC_01216]|uniref:RecB family exonuclease n=1 Tax=Streptomyces sp. NBC_01216 TaxID=2903778 RepID=UPI002E0DF108|nr:PD-(D/E)XK nuclease family protein [Streptomyces sp. NBC_01216]
MTIEANYERWAGMARSVSQITEFEECRYKSWLKRVERVQPRPAAWSTHGTAFHTAAERFELGGREVAAEDAVSIFRDEYTKGISRDLETVNDVDLWLRANRGSAAQDLEERYEVGSRQTREYVEYVQEHAPVLWRPDGEKPAIELYFMADFEGVKLRGYIDQVVKNKDDSNRVRDLKTGSTRSKFQLWVYEMALNRLYPEQEATSGDWYLAKTGKVSRPVKLADADQDEIIERIVRMDQGVKSGDFPASPGFACRFCDVAYACPFARR